MDALADWIDWLNYNSGAVNALATTLSVAVASLAAWTAIVTVTRSKRRERCIMDVFVNASPIAIKTNGGYEAGVVFGLQNLGPADPIFTTFDFDHRLGDRITPLRVGESETFTQQPVDRCKEWCRVRISWIEPDGHKRRLRFWYRIESDDLESPENRRKYLRVDRDERASYLTRPRYLRRLLSPRAYVAWHIRQYRRRKEFVGAQREIEPTSPSPVEIRAPKTPAEPG